MSEAAANRAYEIKCPHCKREFRAELLPGRFARHNGFKCPHCRLFVPYERADGDDAPGTVA